ncbi:alkane 1-monooxygenase [Lolliginicoccus suaedae]|uniref:alkane 1-monooxygenase n=1 Tax=Lolliginicoccus suaedae TaxID=2605429 RepID=UPI001F1FEE2D|nr:alkane 1-monooxygenase [Lolliginicoccus suaedae]
MAHQWHDLAFGADGENPPESLTEELEADRYYRAVLYLFLPAQYIALFIGAAIATRMDVSWIGYVGIAWSVGVVGGLAINTAHELGHKKLSLERWLSKIALAPTLYGHFFVEHNRGHHVRVATPEDHASSRFGEGYWTFWLRSVRGAARSAWRLEKDRFARLGKSHWSLRNDVLNAWLMSAVLVGVLVVAFGPMVLPYFLIQAVIGFSILESANYTEHYGLLRQKTASGRYERVTPRHSWNCNSFASNLFMFHLQRHSDHHANPTRRYQALRDFKEAPQLPSGYATMFILALVPPVWRAVMDKRVLAHYDGDITRVNIHPPKREKILARYAGASPAR